MKKIRVGVVGCGRLGRFHAEKIVAIPTAQLVGVFDPLKMNRDRVAEEQSVAAYDSVEKMLPEVEAVVIAAPSENHEALGEYFLAAGCHLLMEKPLCTTAAGAKRLVAIAEQRRVVLAVGHVEQFNPVWRAAQAFRAATPGALLIDAVRTSGYTFRSVDVGAVLDLMIHDLELVLSLVDSTVKNVSAGGIRLLGGHEDMGMAQVTWADGSVARFFASRIEPVARREMTIRSRVGGVRIDFATRTATQTTPSDAILRGDFAPNLIESQAIPVPADFMAANFSERVEVFEPFDALACQMDDFLDAIGSQRPPKVPGNRAADAVVLAEEIFRAVGSS